MDLIVVYIAPIPVGHRVRVTWYQEVQRGLVPGQERTDDRPHQPVLTDLDTGIEYASDWTYAAGRRRHPDAPYDVGDTPRQDLREERVVEGTVERVRVLTVRGYPNLEVQTHLTLGTL